MPKGKFSFPKRNIIRKKNEIQFLFKKGKFFSNGCLRFRHLSSEKPVQFLFSVSKKFGNAPERNHLKRQLREIVRLSSLTNSVTGDIAIYVTSSPRDRILYSQLQREVESFFSSIQ